MMAQVLMPLPSAQETQMETQAPGFGLGPLSYSAFPINKIYLLDFVSLGYMQNDGQVGR